MTVEPRRIEGLYERLLEERSEEERLRGRSLGEFHGLDSKVLDRKLGNAPFNQSDYRADMYKLYRFINNGIHSRGSAMQFASLKRKYSKEYGEIRAERMGQGEIF